MPYRTADLDHLLDLLELIPWEATDGGSEAPDRFRETFDATRWSLLNNCTIDYNQVCDGARAGDVVYRLCMYLQSVFDGLPDEHLAVVGELIAATLGVYDAPAEAIGRRWCDDVAASSWRILVSHVATSERAARRGVPADMTPHA
ncbi:hypothetical protein [Prauserella endophytica]|uniref:Uncharacterized protein n=1 Tax=Prauserella endophytica TaxID=1592324 RepID=A0ABY2RV15_9PSEU|nr:hypothetical protein [Prauserella endophytica]TKG61551.1 hypothetical protein FCN18_33470 [Prauserella endophytica]